MRFGIQFSALLCQHLLDIRRCFDGRIDAAHRKRAAISLQGVTEMGGGICCGKGDPMAFF